MDLVDFARYLKIQVTIDPNRASFRTNTEGMHIISLNISASSIVANPLFAKRELLKQLAHELGHYIAAPKERRCRTNYGIPEFNSRYSRAKWDFDELKAVLIEHDLLRRFRIKGALKHPLRSHYKRFNMQKPHASRWYEETGRGIIQKLVSNFRTKPLKKLWLP